MIPNHARAFAALGDPTRRLLFERVARRSMSVRDLAAGLSVTRPAVSQHLKVLKSAGLVTTQAVGTRRIYSVDQRGLAAMRTYLDRFWDHALPRFTAAAETDLPKEKGI